VPGDCQGAAIRKELSLAIISTGNAPRSHLPCTRIRIRIRPFAWLIVVKIKCISRRQMHKLGPDYQDVRRLRPKLGSSPALEVCVWVSKAGFVKFME